MYANSVQQLVMHEIKRDFSNQMYDYATVNRLLTYLLIYLLYVKL